MKNLRKYAPIVIRLALASVFLWFGLNQLFDPETFFGYIPKWIYPHALDIIHENSFQGIHSLALTPRLLVMGNGLFETIFGLLLLVGLFTRISSLLLSAHLMFIAFNLGYNDLFVRDFGLSLATFSIFLNGPDEWCIDNRWKNQKNRDIKKIKKQQ